ncbi:MAG: hypothetical protein ACYDEP_03800 [Acidimicrobiales bacterium]
MSRFVALNATLFVIAQTIAQRELRNDNAKADLDRIVDQDL